MVRHRGQGRLPGIGGARHREYVGSGIRGRRCNGSRGFERGQGTESLSHMIVIVGGEGNESEGSYLLGLS